MFTISANSNTFEVAPAGEHIARFIKIVDLGTQTGIYNDKATSARKLMLSWELLGKSRKSNGSPFILSKIYTRSLHERATLRKDLEAWRGEPITASGQDSFDLLSMLGQYCRVWVQHSFGDSGRRANVASILPLPDDFARPDPVNEVTQFSLETPDFDVFLNLSQGVRNMIEKSPEWKHNPATQDWLSTPIKGKAAERLLWV